MGPSPLLVGMDVAKATLDIAVRPTAETWSVSNDAPGLDALVLRLGAWAPTLIVLEAPGGSQGPLVAALVAAALPVVVVNPRHLRALAQAVGLLANTDRLMRASLRPVRRPSSRRPGPCRMPRPQSCGPCSCDGVSSSRW